MFYLVLGLVTWSSLVRWLSWSRIKLYGQKITSICWPMFSLSIDWKLAITCLILNNKNRYIYQKSVAFIVNFVHFIQEYLFRLRPSWRIIFTSLWNPKIFRHFGISGNSVAFRTRHYFFPGSLVSTEDKIILWDLYGDEIT